MKILFMTDTHLGVRNGSNIFREMFRYYYKNVLFPYIRDNNISKIIHLGDFFDSRTSINLSDISYVMNEFIPMVEDSCVTMYIIAGNHDTAFRNTNEINSLSIFKKSENIKVVDDDIEYIGTKHKNFVLVPWLNQSNQDEILQKIEKYSDKNHILCGHLEVIGSPMYKNSKLCEHGLSADIFKGFYKVLSGHFHEPSRNGVVEYIGALFHYTWQDHGCWRGFRVYDSLNDSWESVKNENELFLSISYNDEISIDNFSNEIKGKFIVVSVDNEYDKIKLKSFIHDIESRSPFKVDVIDKSLENFDINIDTEGNHSIKIKEIDEYVDELLIEHKEKNKISSFFSELMSEAKNQMNNVE